MAPGRNARLSDCLQAGLGVPECHRHSDRRVTLAPSHSAGPRRCSALWQLDYLHCPTQRADLSTRVRESLAHTRYGRVEVVVVRPPLRKER